MNHAAGVFGLRLTPASASFRPPGGWTSSRPARRLDKRYPGPLDALGQPRLELIVVPDLGTGALASLAGRPGTRVTPDGRHFYDLDYELAHQQEDPQA
ncbi:DUF3224 domain-containing protein [Rubrivivax gelatinosus]|uniref:Uncharacterized protein DUF3224 n=1 Tax=Rubrivivax gelatinosus TaxID=28068 RepID=A0A4R2MGZ6_RUBGE|nr:DUF3224 domain-containing protein [Rubrivivax gelatinosus]MBK1689712.1 hypothetical protein [Rubrivivax gelatinosus]TCP03854.1 uncharacterized protein DUF3224 [Rubrivivax gelatinosus]